MPIIRTGTGVCPYGSFYRSLCDQNDTGRDNPLWLSCIRTDAKAAIIRTARGPLYQLIHYRDRFAVPPFFREAIANRAIAKVHQRKPSRTARKSVSQPTSLFQPTSQAVSCRAITKALCAVPSPSAHESGIFCLLFFAVEKK